MADNYKAILEELCRTAFNFPAGELQELVGKPDADLTADDITAISTKVKTRQADTITSINKTNNLKLQEKYNAGQRKKAEEIEAALKEKFEVESDKTGPELIDEVVLLVNTKSAKKTGDKITDDDVRSHPFYIKQEAEFKKTLKKATDDAKAEVDKVTAEQSRQQLLTKVTTKGLEIFDGLNPILSADAVKAANQRNSISERLSEYEWQEVDGKFIPMKDGKALQDEFGHTTEFEKLVPIIAGKYFDFKAAAERQAPNGKVLKPGDPGYKAPDPKNTYTGALPKTEAEWQKMMNDKSIPISDKKTINEHWTKQQQPAA